MRFNLRSLDVSGHVWLDWNYANDFAKALTCLKQSLQHLNLSYCLQHLPLESIIIIATALRGLERLQSIDLSCNSISASSMGVLGLSFGYLTTLRALNLSINEDLITEDGASHISAALTKLAGLTFLGMSDVSSGLSLAGVQQLRVLTPSLAALTKLECLDLERSVFLASEEIASSVLAPALRQLSTLTQLTVGDCKMDTGFADDLANNESLVVRAVLRLAVPPLHCIVVAAAHVQPLPNCKASTGGIAAAARPAAPHPLHCIVAAAAAPIPPLPNCSASTAGGVAAAARPAVLPLHCIVVAAAHVPPLPNCRASTGGVAAAARLAVPPLHCIVVAA
ncbi:hypothetical protein CEUSTIGMA_g3777.t1, partial [Chlamydomonas eustigma]